VKAHVAGAVAGEPDHLVVGVFVNPFVGHFLASGFHYRLCKGCTIKTECEKGENTSFHICNLGVKNIGLTGSAILLRHEKEEKFR
ncbi:MAG TPA: hypothetical protein VFL47_09760, partial [Flavisolibacter sp.]|nr:hypothetical protein [Flavisolibacter sp.]